MHCDYNSAHQIHIIIGIQFIDANFSQKYDRFFEVAVLHWYSLRAIQIGSIHAVHRIDDAMEASTKIANVPHPLEHWRDVSISRTKSKHRK